ncbi:MAG: phosphoglucosamine mutase [Candidatus Heimdallarchaeota archaeon]|nr:phosphoglucosamine mutase [Candidatus Heimdallarchaeota archaeon]
MNRKYFGTNGIRGIIGDLITPGFISKMGSAIASMLKYKGTVIIGADSRLSSPFIKNSVISSFLASGIEVIDLDVVPTPLVQFAVKHLHANMGVVVTASHNSPQFNGLKVIDYDGIEIDIRKQLKVEEIFEKEQFSYTPWNENGFVTKMNLKQEHIDQIIQLVNIDNIQKKKMSVVVDTGNGAGGVITPELLRQLGVRVITLNGNLDGRFPGRGTEPTPEKLTEISKITLQSKCNFSVAHDVDADRAIFGDEKGNIFFGDKSIVLFEKWFMSNHENKQFVTPVSSSSAVVDIADEMGGKVIWTPVGCIFVSREMISKNILLGGEENGGLFYGLHQSVRDGAMAAALMANILAETEKTFSDLVLELPKYIQKKDKLPCPNELKKRVMDNIVATIPETVEHIDMDGVKLIYDEGWILIRPSGTEPIFRIFVEAKTEKNTNKIMTKGMRLVQNALQKLS